MSDDHPTPESLGFSGCIAELDRIVRGLETDDIDVDHLADSVTRAAELVEWCRIKLGDARMTVEQILPRLEVAPHDDPAADEDAG